MQSLTESEVLDGPRRDPVADAVRGCGLLGILLVNIQEHLAPPQHLTDSLVRLGVSYGLDGKCYPMFAFLFGMGCERHLGMGSVSGMSRLVRRLCVLYGIALLFFVLLDDQSILLEYAVAGLVIAAACRWLKGAVHWLSIASLLAAILLPVLHAIDNGEPPVPQTLLTSSPRDQVLQAASEKRRSMTYTQWLESRLGRFVASWPTANRLDHWLSVLGVALGGAAFGAWRRRSEHDIDDGLLRRVHRAAGVLAVACVAAILFIEVRAFPGVNPRLLAGIHRGLLFLFGPSLALAYAIGLSHAVRMIPSSIDLLSAAGRMTLSNFVFQSMAMTFLFYHFGLGLEGRLGATSALVLSAGFWLFQIWMSNRLLNSYRHGPLEWLWRQMAH